MDQIIDIFIKLSGNDYFAFHLGVQFIIVCIIFILAKYILFNKLQFVIENREAKTTKLEGDAEKKLEKASELSEKYRAKIDIAYSEAQKIITDSKSKIVSEQDSLFKESEKQTFEYIEKSRQEVMKGLEGKKQEIFKEAEGLAESLVNKITK